MTANRSFLMNALTEAASVYAACARAHDDVPRLADQFHKQAATARALIAAIEQADTITLED